MITFVIAGVVVLAAIVAYKLFKSGKAVTGKAVVAGVETDVKNAVDAVKTDVATKVVEDVAKKL